MATTGKYVESGYEFVYTAKIPFADMRTGSVIEERKVFIPSDTFSLAYDVAQGIMGESNGYAPQMISLVPTTRTKKGDS